MIFRIGALSAALTLAACQPQAPTETPRTSEQKPDPANFMEAPKVAAAPAPEAPAAAPPAEPESKWTYWKHEDPMTGKLTRNAVITSSNTLNFGFPYGGEQHGRIAIRKHPSHGNDVILQIERGQILCHSYADDCPIKIRFDDGKAFTVTGSNAADNSSEVVFLPGFKSLTSKMAKAKVMRVQFNAYQQGAPVLTFDVSGFDPERMK